VVVPCRNEISHIEACVRSILQQEDPPGGIEVLVAEGISEDGTRKLLEQLTREDSRIRVIENRGRIASTGLNAAIRSAKAKTIVRMDAHTEYAPDYVKRCVEVLQRTGADNVGGPARTRSETYLQSAVAAAYHSPFSVGGARFHVVDHEGYVDTVPYGCWRKEAFERFGYFDEELARNQDDEHNLRIIRAGGKIWQSPQIRSWYRPRASLVALFRQYMQYGYWKVRVIQKHKLPASWRHLVPGASLVILTLLLLAFLFSLPLGWWPFAIVPLLSAVCSYGVCVLAASIHTASKSEWRLLPILPLVFPCYHFGYGYGFLRGIWDFMIRGKQPGKQFVQLTRAASATEKSNA
jgi:succinoglycan biosynthesis protein ExoA